MKGKGSKIIFLTSTNLASNPRCLKEIEVARELGYTVTVFAFDIPNWTRKVEVQIRSRLKGIEYYSLPAARTPWLPWLINSLAGEGAKGLYRLGWRSALISAVVTDKRALTLLKALRKRKPAGDLIIAHNPGAFYPAWWLSRKKGIPIAVDVEDFHPGENNAPVVKETVTRTMAVVLPAAAYVSFASPMIREASLALFPKPGLTNTLVINNVFAAGEFVVSSTTNSDGDRKLKLVWFSQHISFSRGLDEILPLLQPFAQDIQLTLIGNVDAGFKAQVLDQYTFIVCKEPVPQEVLNRSLEAYDIGLALESNKTDENRKLCLTNKIWAYLQSGLYIWANNTPAQMRFAQSYPLHTSVIDLEKKETVTTLIQESLDNMAMIRNNKAARAEINQQVNWENEQKKLIHQWEKLALH